MNPERFRRVDQVFQQALSQPPEGVDSFLVDTCAGDSDLRREVESCRPFAEDARALGSGKPLPGDWTGWDFSQETFGHKGSTGTFLWIDPQRELFIVFLNNRVQSKHPDRRAPARHHGVYCARSYRTSYEHGTDRTFIGEVRR